MGDRSTSQIVAKTADVPEPRAGDRSHHYAPGPEYTFVASHDPPGPDDPYEIWRMVMWPCLDHWAIFGPHGTSFTFDVHPDNYGVDFTVSETKHTLTATMKSGEKLQVKCDPESTTIRSIKTAIVWPYPEIGRALINDMKARAEPYLSDGPAASTPPSSSSGLGPGPQCE